MDITTAQYAAGMRRLERIRNDALLRHDGSALRSIAVRVASVNRVFWVGNRSMRSDGSWTMWVRAMRMVGLTFALVGLSSAGMAQSEADQKQACMGDAFRFCATSIPDRQAVGQCLATNREQLTPACRSMIDNGRSGRAKKG